MWIIFNSAGTGVMGKLIELNMGQSEEENLSSKKGKRFLSRQNTFVIDLALFSKE